MNIQLSTASFFYKSCFIPEKYKVSEIPSSSTLNQSSFYLGFLQRLTDEEVGSEG